MGHARRLGVALLLAGSVPAAAAPFSNMIIFGDSLSDTGNAHVGAQVMGLPDPTPASEGYFNGRFSDGLMYVDTLNIALVGGLSNPFAPILFGLPAPSGLNFSVGGGRVVPNAAPANTDDFPAQLGYYQNYLTATGGSIDPNALYVINGGSNDVRSQIQGAADAPTNLAVATGIASLVETLYNGGARHLLVMNVGDLGTEPVFNGLEAVARAASAALNSQLNTTLDATLDALFGPTSATSTGTYQVAAGKYFTYFDTFDWGDAVLADPTDFGLPAGIDFETPCFDVQSPPVNCSNYAWSDAIHPSSPVHIALGNSVLPYLLDQSAQASAAIGGTALGGRLTSSAALVEKTDFVAGCGLPGTLGIAGTPTGNQVASGTTVNVRRAPGGVGGDCYLSVGFGSLTLDFLGEVEYAGFYLGSIDEYNTFEFFADSGTPGVPGSAISFGSYGTLLDGTELAALFSIGLYTDNYFNFNFSPSEYARYLRIGSTNTAAEFGEVAWRGAGLNAPLLGISVAEVPAPAMGWLLLGGAAFLGLRRRR